MPQRLFYKKLKFTLKASALVVFSTICFACSRYSISVNENVLYEPPPLFADFKIRDRELDHCIRATIHQHNLTRAEQLEKLFCPPGDISSLDGMEIFTSLRQFGVADNQITEIAPLQNLKRLTHLNLANNVLSDVSVIGSLENLVFLDLQGNNQLRCESIKNSGKPSLEIDLPDHCL